MVDGELIMAISRAVKGEIEPLAKEVQKTNERLDRLKENADRLEAKTDELRDDLRDTQLYLENDVRTAIDVMGRT